MSIKSSCFIGKVFLGLFVYLLAVFIGAPAWAAFLGSIIYAEVWGINAGGKSE